MYFDLLGKIDVDFFFFMYLFKGEIKGKRVFKLIV